MDVKIHHGLNGKKAANEARGGGLVISHWLLGLVQNQQYLNLTMAGRGKSHPNVVRIGKR